MDILLWTAAGAFAGCLGALYMFAFLAGGGTTAEIVAKAANRVKDKMLFRIQKGRR